ncbi:cytochrome P450 [Hyphomonas pacifica]|nr:cytochrome P450 [Hyphomonas pacifica]
MAAMPQLSALAPNQLFPGLLEDRLSDEKPVGSSIANLIKNQLFSTNPPLNPVLRRILLKQIGPKPTGAKQDDVKAIAVDILNNLPQGESVDFVEKIAEPLIGRFWGYQLGMTDEEALEAAVHARNMTPMLFLQHDPESFYEADNAAENYRTIVETASMRSLQSGGCPFVEHVAMELKDIDIADDLDYTGHVPKSAGAFLAGNLFDGFHTAALAVTNTVRTLLEHPDMLTELQEATPEKRAAIVAECLRVEPPVIHLSRYASADIEYGGYTIPKGTHVLMMWGVANRDPGAFPEPDHFDPNRSQQGSTTFGGGAHICPGRFVASLVAKCLLDAITECRINIRPAGDMNEWIGNHAMCQLRHLPVILERRES